jgi:hypothetical protein
MGLRKKWPENQLEYLKGECDLDASTSNQLNFDAKVEKERVLHGLKKSVTTHLCFIYSKRFDVKWKLNRHNGQCHQPGVTKVRVGKLGEYRCSICESTSETRVRFNRHMLLRHGDVQVFARYFKTAEELVGAYLMEQLRQPLFMAIMTGKWDKLLDELISPAAPLGRAKIDYYYSW